ncbi:MAG: TRAP transporter small permease subunit [Minwuia sp.]|uniref:TRAP transporter small permease subunit n=1 Tax=Minwuia sp. TaxID=2493630 RepID=UPI003A884E24
MSSSSDSIEIPKYGLPAPIVRSFGWAMLAILAAFLINNVLTVAYDFPGASAVFGEGGGLSILQVAIYLIGIALAVIYVLRTGDRSLRWESHSIHLFNLYLVRVCFWAVLLVGAVDVTIAFMRVEDLLSYFMGEDSVRALGRARFVGTWIHMPLIAASFIIGAFTRTLGFTWLALLIVIAELLIVITRFVFSYEQALMGDLVRYWYAALFLFASAYTLFDEGHVRVDVLYSGFRRRTKGWVNAVGALALGMTTSWIIIEIGFDGPRSIINSPVGNFEISQTGAVGMFIKYQMAAFIGIFAITMLIQFVSYFFEAVADYRDEPGHRDHEPVTQ